MWKEFFYFSLIERRGVIVIAVLIAIVCVGAWLIPNHPMPVVDSSHEQFQEEYLAFMNSLERVEKEQKDYSSSTRYKKQKEIVLADFDPNTADSIEFSSLGLPGWMINNIHNYRNKGGRFKKAEDFAKIYGLKEEQYLALLPYIQIAPIHDESKDSLRLLVVETKKDSFPKTMKYEKGTIIALNSADTFQLKMIPGIGSAIARSIISYRTQLGGFYSIAQLQEINLRADSLVAWFDVKQDLIQRLSINKMGVDRLRKHPYINFYQAKAIVEHRKKRGKIKDLEDLKLYEEFTQSDMERLKHYFQFD